jgi:hypothetical protein
VSESGNPENKAPVEKVDPALLEEAVDVVRGILRGNGVRPDDVTLAGFEGEVLHFEVFEKFRVEPKVSEKLVHGRERGEVVGSQQLARHKVQTAVEKAARNPDIRQITNNILKRTKNLGFGSDGQMIKFERLKQSFVSHDICSVCSGKMKVLCQPCHGTGKMLCAKCRGTKEILCPFCHGKQFENTPQGRRTCSRCRGRGRIRCVTCKQTGSVPCPSCKSVGQMVCKNCTGTGWHSHVTYVEIRAKSEFFYDREKLPPEVPPLIDSLRKELITDQYVEAYINEDKRRTEELDRKSRADEYIVPYNVRLPWGEIKFKLKDEEVAMKLFGFSPGLVHAPPFLEKLVAPAIRALEEASATPRHTADKVKDATRFRLAAEALLATAQMPPRKALDYMHRKYPFGIRTEYFRHILTHAHTALQRLTRGARAVGVAAGIALAAMMDALYFIGPVRSYLQRVIGAESFMLIPDAVWLGIGVAVAILTVKLFTAFTIHRTLGKFLPPQKRGRLTPKIGRSAGWAAGGAAIAFFAAIAFAATQGFPVPVWFAPVLHMMQG